MTFGKGNFCLWDSLCAEFSFKADFLLTYGRKHNKVKHLCISHTTRPEECESKIQKGSNKHAAPDNGFILWYFPTCATRAFERKCHR